MIRICNNEACYWSGPVDDTKSLLPHIHNLCPECGETTEEATASETEEYFAEWVTLLQREAADLRRQLAAQTVRGDLALALNAQLEAERAELRRQLVECQAQIAAIPSAALRRSFYTGYSSDAQVEEDEIAIAAWLEVQP